MLSAASILLIVYAVIILIALGGNLLVCVAVYCDRILRRQQENLFLVSLAVSDLLISLLVMSFAASNDILGYWPFGHLYCQLWICFDITCTTASILNLSAIALHRFLHISRPLVYVRRRKVFIVIIFVWLISAIIGFTQIILESAQRNGGNVKYNDSQPRCELRLKPLYALGSSMCSFVIPAAMMILLYTRLYLFAREHAKTMRIQLQQAANFSVTLDACEGIQNNSNVGFFCERIFATCRRCHRNNLIVSERVKSKIRHHNFVSLIGKPALISDMQFKAVTWLGYANSTANPIIYTILNRDFRIAFKRYCLMMCYAQVGMFA